MSRRVAIEVWACPVCWAERGFRGQPFMSPWQIALHIVGKAQKPDLQHQERIRGWIPYVNFSWTNNQIAEQIVEFVQEAGPRETATEESETIDASSLEVPLALYQSIRDIEIGLHSFIRRTLQDRFGINENDWWVQGVPETVRIECATRREKTPRGKTIFCTRISLT